MHGLETVVEIKVLARQGKTIRQIARELGVSRNTVRRYLRKDTAVGYGPRDPRPTRLDSYQAYLLERIARRRWEGGRMAELKERIEDPKSRR
jgi:transposase